MIVPVQMVLKFPTDELSPIVTPASITVYAPMVTLLPSFASPLTCAVGSIGVVILGSCSIYNVGH